MKWDSETIMMTGGYHWWDYFINWYVRKDSSLQDCWHLHRCESARSKKTYFINFAKKTWTVGPEMLSEHRVHHACSEITIDGEEYVVVVGGYSGYKVRSTEILSKKNYQNGWQKSKKLRIFF